LVTCRSKHPPASIKKALRKTSLPKGATTLKKQKAILVGALALSFLAAPTAVQAGSCSRARSAAAAPPATAAYYSYSYSVNSFFSSSYASQSYALYAGNAMAAGAAVYIDGFSSTAGSDGHFYPNGGSFFEGDPNDDAFYVDTEGGSFFEGDPNDDAFFVDPESGSFH
jgi:hypothetical protein